MARLCQAEKSISLGIRTHFLSFWNYLDAGNMVLQLMAGLNVNHVVGLVSSDCARIVYICTLTSSISCVWL